MRNKVVSTKIVIDTLTFVSYEHRTRGAGYMNFDDSEGKRVRLHMTQAKKIVPMLVNGVASPVVMRIVTRNGREFDYTNKGYVYKDYDTVSVVDSKHVEIRLHTMPLTKPKLLLKNAVQNLELSSTQIVNT